MPGSCARPDRNDMVGYEIQNKRRVEPNRAIRVRLEVFLVAALIVLLALPAFGMVRKATSGMSCVRSTIQTSASTCQNP
jgi:hypothetical protein